MIECTACTFANSDLLNECEICGTSLSKTTTTAMQRPTQQNRAPLPGVPQTEYMARSKPGRVKKVKPAVVPTNSPSKKKQAHMSVDVPLSVGAASFQPNARGGNNNNLNNNIKPINTKQHQKSKAFEHVHSKVPAVSDTVAIVYSSKDLEEKPEDAVACRCHCTRHTLVGSCTQCGRPICEEEEWMLRCGCIHCGQPCLPPTAADDIREKASAGKWPWGELSNEQLENTIKAYTAKDRLLTFDKQHTRRTHVFDAQADYYESSAWLSPEEKARIDAITLKRRTSKKPSNRKYQVTIDIAGRKVYTEDDEQLQQEEQEKQDNQREMQEGQLHSKAEADLEENEGLKYSTHKAGEVYRLLKESLAPWRPQV
jgi:hypothetical protein